MKFNYSGNIAWQIIGEEAVIIDLTSGRTVGLNPTATFVWSRLPHQEIPQIVAELKLNFEPVESVMADVQLLIDDLSRRNVIVPAEV